MVCVSCFGCHFVIFIVPRLSSRRCLARKVFEPLSITPPLKFGIFPLTYRKQSTCSLVSPILSELVRGKLRLQQPCALLVLAMKTASVAAPTPRSQRRIAIFINTLFKMAVISELGYSVLQDCSHVDHVSVVEGFRMRWMLVWMMDVHSWRLIGTS